MTSIILIFGIVSIGVSTKCMSDYVKHVKRNGKHETVNCFTLLQKYFYTIAQVNQVSEL